MATGIISVNFFHFFLPQFSWNPIFILFCFHESKKNRKTQHYSFRLFFRNRIGLMIIFHMMEFGIACAWHIRFSCFMFICVLPLFPFFLNLLKTPHHLCIRVKRVNSTPLEVPLHRFKLLIRASNSYFFIAFVLLLFALMLKAKTNHDSIHFAYTLYFRSLILFFSLKNFHISTLQRLWRNEKNFFCFCYFFSVCRIGPMPSYPNVVYLVAWASYPKFYWLVRLH